MDPVFDNGLSPAEAERLALLLEELGEAQQCIGKILRYGYESFNPYLPPPAGETNRGNLTKELGDVIAAMNLMRAGGDIDEEEVISHAQRKMVKVWDYLHHQPHEIWLEATGSRSADDGPDICVS
jgi:NTP pyrophosphatase (non-canonical NTP hydrolase)